MPKRKKTREPGLFLYDDGTYFVRCTPMGSKQRIERSLGKVSFTEARELKQLLLKKLDETGVYSKTLSVSDLFPKYIEDKFDEKLSEATKYEITLWSRDYLIPFFGSYTPSEIDEDLFEKFIKWQRKRRDLNFFHPRKVLMGFLNWCRKKKYIRFIPKFDIPKWEHRERVNLTQSQITTLFAKCDNQDLLLFIIMYLFMGMRSSEITQLSWDRVDFLRKAITLRKQDTKTRQGREVPINLNALRLLVNRYENSGSKFVFPNVRSSQRPMDPTGFKKAWNRLIEACGFDIRITPHDLRATWENFTNRNPNFTDAQREKMAGSNIKVQKNTYVKFTADELRGLENVVQVDGLQDLLIKKIGGNLGEDK